jgi:hypothetical protein
MASGDQREGIEAIFAGLIGRGEIDVAPAEEGSGFEIRADQWTLAIEDDPVTVAFLAVDDEPGDPASLGQALETALEPDDLDALRKLDHRWEGSLRMALQASGDMLSMELATLLAEQPETRA